MDQRVKRAMLIHRLPVSHLLVGVQLVDGFAYRGAQGRRITIGPSDKESGGGSFLIQREIVNALAGALDTYRRRFLADHLGMAHGRNDGHDGFPRRILSIADTLSNGIMIGPILTRKILVNDRHRLTAHTVLVRENTPANQPNAHGL